LLPVALSLLRSALVLGVGHRETALQLLADVVPVRVGVLEEELAVDIGDLAAEGVVEVLGEGQVEPPSSREELRSRLDADAHLRVCEFRPGNSDLDVLELDLLLGEAGYERLHHPGAAGDVARHRACVVEAGREREASVERYEPVARLETDDAAAGRRYPDRASRVGAERGVGELRRERGCRAAARAAGETTRGQRVRHRPEVRVLGGRSESELVEIRLADVDIARSLEPLHSLRAVGRNVLGEEDRAIGRDEAGGVEEILDRERDAYAGILRPCEKDPLELGHSFGALSTPTGAEFLITLASGRRLGEP